jgi:hypothetical protein
MNKEIKQEKLNAWEYPTDRFMKELTCSVFNNLVMEAGLINRSIPARAERKRLSEIKSFAEKNSDYWWSCLKEFCPTIDRKKIKRKIIDTVNKTLEKL